jgi:hypothetical protein
MKPTRKKLWVFLGGDLIPLVLLGIASHTSPAVAESAVTFTQSGSMFTDRAGHTATLLLDGRVLIAGGVIPVPA